MNIGTGKVANLILFYIMCQNQLNADAAGRISHDTEAVLDITNKIGAGPVEVSSVVRLGKKVDGRRRLIKVRLSNMQQKHKVLANAKKLRSLSSTLQKVFITPDQSQKERQQNKVLYDELLTTKAQQLKLTFHPYTIKFVY